MGDWRDNPVNNPLSGRGEWYDSPTIQDELMKQKLLGQGVPAEQLPVIMAQVKQAQDLKSKIALTDGLPIGSDDTLQAQPNMAFTPEVTAPQMPAQAAPPMVADGGAPAATPSPSSPPAAGAASIYDRLGPDGLEQLLGMGGIDEQREQAMYLRNKEGPEGVGFGNSTGGTTFVAANPLSHLASGVEKYRAKKDIKRLRDEEKEGNRTIIDLLRNKKQEPEVGSGFGVI